MGRPPGTDYVSSLHGRVCVCVLGGVGFLGSARRSGFVVVLSLSSVVGSLCVCLVHVAWWRTGASPGFDRTGV